MQILLNKQYKADKKAETEKIERQIQQQQERDEEMRELAIKLRKRQRELRHKYGEDNKDSRTNSDSDAKETKGPAAENRPHQPLLVLMMIEKEEEGAVDHRLHRNTESA